MKIITYITKTFKWFYCGVFKRVLSLLAIPGRNRLREKVQLRYEIFVNKGIKIPFYHYGRDNSLFIDNIIEEVNRVLCLSNDKEIDLYTKQFEEQFAEYCNCQYAVGLSSGTTALVYSLIAAGVKPGDEVILPPNTYIATAMAVQDMGARPVFVDIDPNNYNIAVERIPDVITDKTRAVIPVHLFGHMVNMDHLNSIAQKYNLVVIEDACQAHGAEFKGRRAGSYGMTGCFSLHISKMMGCLGEGGIVVTNDVSTYHTILNICEPYWNRPVALQGKRTPARLSYIHSAIGKAKLEKIEESIRKKNNLARVYFENLSGITDIQLPPMTIEGRDNYRNFTVRVKHRGKLMDYLFKKGIETKIFYEIPIHLSETFGYLGYKKGDFSVGETFAEESLSLPISIYLTESDIKFICDKIRLFYS